MSKKADSAALVPDGSPPPPVLEAVTLKKKPLDLTGAINVTTLTVPVVMAMSGGHGIVVGGEFKGGGHFGGVVRRMALLQNGALIVIVELGASYQTKTGSYGAFIFFGSGMYSEVDNDGIEPITEENCGPWQDPIGAH